MKQILWKIKYMRRLKELLPYKTWRELWDNAGSEIENISGDLGECPRLMAEDAYYALSDCTR